jgi:hypothetical protein
MRLFRQTIRGDWSTPIRDAADRLKTVVTSGNPPPQR